MESGCVFCYSQKTHPDSISSYFCRVKPIKIEEMEKNNLKEEEWNTYECEVYLSHCACITKYVKARTLEAAITYLEKKYPEATCVCEADHWR